MTTLLIPTNAINDILRTFQPDNSIMPLLFNMPIKTIDIPPIQTKFPRSKRKRIRNKWAKNRANYSNVGFIVNEDLIKPSLHRSHPAILFLKDILL